MPGRAQQCNVLHDRQARSRKEPLHHVLVHAGGRAEDSGPDVSFAGQLKETLDCAVLAEGAVQHRKRTSTRVLPPGRAPWGVMPGPAMASGVSRRHTALRLAARAFKALPPPAVALVPLASMCCASSASSQWPVLAMPMGTTSYFFLSMAARTEAAERSETSCSPERPPKMIPTRSFRAIGVVSLSPVARLRMWPELVRYTGRHRQQRLVQRVLETSE